MFPYRLGGYPMGHMIEKKGDLLARVKGIAGQVSAVERGLDRDAGCAEILHLVAAVRGAVPGLLDEIVVDHFDEHVAKPGLSDAARQMRSEETTSELQYIMQNSYAFLHFATHKH